MNAFIFFLSGFPIANVISAFRISNVSGQFIVVILLLGSIFAWSVMITKFLELKTAMKASKQFLSAYRNSNHPMMLFLMKRKYTAVDKYSNTPMYTIYQETCRNIAESLQLHETNTAELFMEEMNKTNHSLKGYQIRTMRNLADQVLSEQVVDLEKHMIILATAATSAPFLGLLGTVWGVMDAFGGLALSSSATLAAVAPGVSGALLTTVVGLLIALPSIIGYNVLTGQIRKLSIMMEHFVQELMANIERHFQE